MLKDPEAGDVITGTCGLRKLRYGDATRGKGKRGGLRIIYYWWDPKKQFWLFTIYDKDELSDLSPKEKAILKTLLKQELEERN
jgi:mRNA-degrading endonuclease RelE of RelBE toxin-antitoxin system